ncbi:MAG: hypothetical protein WCP85_23010 [Mariniphaga sp.]
MYLAPLNYDRYFKKVFSDKRIAQRFLEDFFDIKIDELEELRTKHKITDDASAVEFDYRCRIGDNIVIIDMQQWYKTDMLERFHIYHSIDTVLQLEKMPDKSIDLVDNKKKDIKEYDNLVPVITLIWLVDDDLNFTDDFVSFTMTSETVHDFLRNKNLWREENMLELLAERAKCLGIIDNRTRKLDFLQKNKLIYAFQSNIIKNKKFSKYLPWFELADRTRNKLNEKGWFDEYLKDQIFVEIIKRINTETFGESEWEYISDYQIYRIIVERYAQAFIDKRIGKGNGLGITKGEIIKARKIAKTMKDNGEPIDKIVEYTGLTIEEIEKI